MNLYFKSYTSLPPFYPILACVDPNPYSEYGSGSRKLLNADPEPQHCCRERSYMESVSGPTVRDPAIMIKVKLQSFCFQATYAAVFLIIGGVKLKKYLAAK